MWRATIETLVMCIASICVCVDFVHHQNDDKWKSLGTFLSVSRQTLSIDDTEKITPTYIFVICKKNNFAILNLLLAFKTGGRWPWLFLASMTHGFVVEFLAYFAPFIENFWHAQGLITFFDRRMALYIAFLCTYRCEFNISEKWFANWKSCQMFQIQCFTTMHRGLARRWN